ncbi:MAG: type II toxin-antitoxin system RelE/ParE family toxin [Amaricoccus sp.]
MHEIQAFIAHDGPNAAANVVTRLRQSVEILADFPRLAPIYEDGPEHVLAVSGLPYRIFYWVIEATDTVEINVGRRCGDLGRKTLQRPCLCR